MIISIWCSCQGLQYVNQFIWAAYNYLYNILLPYIQKDKDFRRAALLVLYGIVLIRMSAIQSFPKKVNIFLKTYDLFLQY